MCQDDNDNILYGFYFNGNYSGAKPTDFETSGNELLIFEFNPNNDFYLAGSDKYALYDYVMVRINKRAERNNEGMWRTYSIDTSKNKLRLSGELTIDRNNGDFSKFIWDITSLYYMQKLKVGKCGPFDGNLIEMHNAFKKKSISHKKKQDQQFKENKF